MAERVDGGGRAAGAAAHTAPPPGVSGAPGVPGAPSASSRSGAAAASAGTPDIRDIRGLLPIPYPWLLPLELALGALLLALLGWLGVRQWRRRRARGAPQRSPEELAFERLAAAQRLLAEGRAREFSSTVSEAVRLYIEDRLARRAARQTTDELLRELVREPDSPLAPYRDLLADFLQHCDLAKFARQPLTADEMRAMHASAVRFVESLGAKRSEASDARRAPDAVPAAG